MKLLIVTFQTKDLRDSLTECASKLEEFRKRTKPRDNNDDDEDGQDFANSIDATLGPVSLYGDRGWFSFSFVLFVLFCLSVTHLKWFIRLKAYDFE